MGNAEYMGTQSTWGLLNVQSTTVEVF